VPPITPERGCTLRTVNQQQPVGLVTDEFRGTELTATVLAGRHDGGYGGGSQTSSWQSVPT